MRSSFLIASSILISDSSILSLTGDPTCPIVISRACCDLVGALSRGILISFIYTFGQLVHLLWTDHFFNTGYFSEAVSSTDFDFSGESSVCGLRDGVGWSGTCRLGSGE